MLLRLAITPTFMDSLTQLSKRDQAKVIETVRKLGADSRASGLRVHRLDGVANGFTSCSAGMDIRIVGLPYQDALALTYVDHHDKAYEWANRHLPVVDEKKGILEILKIDVKPTESVVNFTNSGTLSKSYGEQLVTVLSTMDLPRQIVDALTQVKDEEELLGTIDGFSAELQEIVLAAATGKGLSAYTGNMLGSDIALINDDEELDNAIRYPVDKWRLFLHSVQKEIVNASITDKLLVIGGPGTGKTIALIHRALKLSQISRPILLLTLSFELAVDILKFIDKLGSRNGILVGSLIRRKHAPSDISIFGGHLFRDNPLAEQPYGFRILDIDLETAGQSFSPIKHILVDEAHDLPTEMQGWLADLLNRKDLGVTISIDTSQIVRNWGGEFLPMAKRLSLSDVREIKLFYNYRMTREVLRYGRKILESKVPLERQLMGDKKKGITFLPRFTTQLEVYGLAGLPVVETTCDESELLKVLNLQVDELKQKYNMDELAILVPDDDKLEVNSVLGVPIIKFPSAKGMEWFAGIVVVDDAFISGTIPTHNSLTELNALINTNRFYVAVTRFRQRVIVVRLRNAQKLSMRFAASAKEYTNSELRQIFAQKNRRH